MRKLFTTRVLSLMVMASAASAGAQAMVADVIYHSAKVVTVNAAFSTSFRPLP